MKENMCKIMKIRIEAIQSLKPPTTAKGFGVVNFLSLFCCKLQKILKCTFDLTRKGREFHWGSEQQEAFDVYA